MTYKLRFTRYKEFWSYNSNGCFLRLCYTGLSPYLPHSECAYNKITVEVRESSLNTFNKIRLINRNGWWYARHPQEVRDTLITPNDNEVLNSIANGRRNFNVWFNITL